MFFKKKKDKEEKDLKKQLKEAQEDIKKLNKNLVDKQKEYNDLEANFKEADQRISDLLTSDFKSIDYKDWEKDLGFLNLILKREKQIVKEFNLKMFSLQLGDKSLIKDDDVNPLIESTVLSVWKKMSIPYKNYLVKKYFGSDKELLEFISEDVNIELKAAAIEQNADKTKKIVGKNRIEIINKNNKKDEK